MLADFHTHLSNYEPEQLAKVISEADNNDVKIFIAASVSLESAKKTTQIAANYEGVFAAVGIHPWNAMAPIDHERYLSLLELASLEKVVAISEIGLDYVRDMFRDRELTDPSVQKIQRQVFSEQVRLAREVNLPMIIHCKEAHRDMMEILRKAEASEIGGGVHGFNGDENMLKDWLDLGFYISVGVKAAASLDERPDLRETFKKIPTDRLVLETDADPSLVKDVAVKLAELRGMTLKEISTLTTNNLKRLLKLPSAKARR